MAEPWIRYKEQGLINPYPEQKPLPYSQGIDPLLGVMETVDYLTTAPMRTGLNESLKAQGPWNKFKAFGKGVVKSFANPGASPTSSEVANRAGLSNKPLYTMGFGGKLANLSPADIGGFVGENVLDPSNLIPAGKAMAVGGLALGGLKKVGKEVGEELAEKGLKNSLGRPVHHAPEGQENFKKWFEGSKVVDEKGQPIVAYHGTGNKPITTFKDSKLGQTTNARSAKQGFWFSNKDVATGYSKLAQDKPVEDLLNKAEIADDKGQYKLAETLRQKAEKLENQVKPEKLVDTYLSIKNPKIYDAEGQRYNELGDQFDDIIIQAKKEGKDGVIFKNLVDNADWSDYTPADHYLVFNNKQIKSATGNSGKFNPKDPNILKGLAPVGPWMLYQQNRQERTQNDNRE